MSTTESNLTPEELQAQIAQLQKALRKAQEAAQPTTSVGERGVNVGGNVDGDIVTGDKYEVLDPNQTDPGVLRDSYLRRLIRETNRLSLSGIDPKAAAGHEQLELSAVYIGLRTTTSDWITLSSENNIVKKALTEGSISRHEVNELLQQVKESSALKLTNQHKKFVLLGDPGSGKSTFVNFAAGCMASELLNDPQLKKSLSLETLCTPLPDDEEARPQPWDHGPLTPVIVTLRMLAAGGLPSANEPATAGHFWRYVEKQLQNASLDNYAPLLQKTLLEEGGLLLFDGLDEVPTAEQHRIHIKQMVEDVAATYPLCRILVTSRTYAYQEQDWRLPSFEVAVLAPFSMGQIKRFVDKWYAHIAQERGLTEEGAQGQATLLKTAIERSSRLQDLAQQPLLLTLMASLHAWRGGSLPEKREELYADAVDLLLDNWNSQRIQRNAQGEITVIEPSLEQWLAVDRDKVRGLLNRLAFEAHRDQAGMEDTANIDESKLIMGLLKLSPEQELSYARLVSYLSHRAGLLLPRGQGVYTFPHRTFQEYLAAVHLTDDEYPEKIAELACQDPNRWREVALLAGAKAGRGSTYAVRGLVDELCPQEPTENAPESEHWGALLAGQLLVEASDLTSSGRAQQTTLERVQRWLVQVVEGDVLSATERAAAGRHLGQLGDPRPEVMTIEAMRFCYVPAGPFWMGSGDDDPDAEDKEKPQHQVDIPYDYWLAQYPLTNAQYNEFVGADGYQDERWWGEAIAAGLWKNGLFKDELFESQHDRQRDFGVPFNLPNHPVNGVSWFECLAYGRWLTAQAQQNGWLSKEWAITLPSEAEWEKAARGGFELPAETTISSLNVIPTIENPPSKIPNPFPQRLYPWGDSPPTAALANFKETKIETVNTPGCFPQGASPHGCLEMSGNVYEWTRSLWKGYPYVGDDGREKLERKARYGTAIRGYGYGSSENALRCGSRPEGDPNFRYVGYVGVRLLLVPIASVPSAL